MDSLFHKEPAEPPPPSPLERIAPEIAHLKKGSSTRHGPGSAAPAIPWVLTLLICALLWLYCMDPVLYSFHKSEAIRAYLYLHNYGAGPQEAELVASQVFTTDEVTTLNRRHGSFQDYFPSPDAANQQAETIVNYMNGVQLLHKGDYQKLDLVGRARYYLFICTGIPLPTQWSCINPSVDE